MLQIHQSSSESSLYTKCSWLSHGLLRTGDENTKSDD